MSLFRRRGVSGGNIQMLPDTHSYPLSLCQQRLWLLDQLRPLNTIYNLSTVLPLPAEVDPARLQQSCNLVVSRHDILRTTFDINEGAPSQIVHPAMYVPLEIVDLGDVTSSPSSALLAAEKRPFNLRSGPLLRTTLFRVSPQLQLFLISMHHIISDGRSVEIFLSEVRHCYESLSTGAPLRLSNLPIQYSDYSVWQRKYLKGQKLHEDLDFWSRTLADLPIVQVPTDFSRQLEPSFDGNEVPIALDQAAVRELAGMGQRQGATLFMTFFAAFCVLLARYSSQDDIVVGTPVSGRNHLQLENLIGFFVNSLILRCDLSGDPTFELLIGRVRATAVAAYDHQELPFEMLVEKLRPPRDLSRNPLFQILFQMQHAQSPGPITAEPSGLPPLLRAQSSPFDIALNLWESSGTVGGTFQYATELFRSDTAAQMARHYANLVSAAAASPQKPISELSILDSAERRLVLGDWDRSAAAPADGRFVHNCVEHYASSTPDAVAVLASEREITYAELNARADSLAAMLRDNAVSRGTRVALRMERSPAALIAILAIWKACGVYMPIDPEYPLERARFMLKDSGTRVLLVSEQTKGMLSADIDCELTVGDSDGEIAEPVAAGAADGVSDRDPAYLIYTSGSTGRPKGVILEHGGLWNVIQAQRQLLPVTCRSSILQFSSLCFDASIFEIALAFGSGATLCIPTRDSLVPDALEFPRILADMAVDTVVIPPPVLATIDSAACPTLKVILLAGDVCPMELAEAWLPGRRVFNLYGPTEATIWATSAELTPGGGMPPIGRPIPHTRAYVLDRNRSPVPIGVQGDLYLAGTGLARGYLNQERLTSECFVPNPFDDSDEFRILYRTGDLCRYRRDGQLEYVGRSDRMVKVRGFRIEPDELETTLRTHWAVRDCCAVVRAQGSADACVIAYVIARSEPSQEILLDLRNLVRRQLPAYMVPVSILFIDALPLNANGKIDRQRLCREDLQVGRFGRPATQPRNAVERVICSVWQEVLNVDRAGVDDSFFELGGHSLLAVRARVLLESRLSRPIKVADLFQFPTPASLATYLFPADENQFASSANAFAAEAGA
jgi:amino acid adenylation domain-containing protein